MQVKVLKLIRILLGWILLWGFLDKTFGLGFATASGKAWIDGVSPTYGFLISATSGPFVEFYKSLAGNPIIDWVFMIGLLLIGLSFILNRYVKYSGWCGSLLMILMYSAAFMPPKNNPIVDEHIIYSLLFAYFAINSKISKNNG